MRRVVSALLVALLLAAAAVVARNGRAADLGPGAHDVTLRFDHRLRSYRVFVPPAARSGRPLAVVVNFHGGGSNAWQQERFSRMDDLAARERFVVVYPNGTGILRRALLTWNAGTCCGYAQGHHVDDVGFTLAVVDDVARRLPVDRGRIYATGMSNGAMMAYRLGAEAAARIAAIAPVAGGMVVESFHPARPVPVMHFHSIDDPRALYDGGLGPPFPFTRSRVLHPAVESVIARWVRFDGCATVPHVGPTIRRDGRTATEIRYAPCRGGAEVVLWRLRGSGHVWPGGSQHVPERLLGQPTSVVDANRLMWAFFRSHPLRA